MLQPTGRQAEALTRLLGAQRSLYNAALEERIGAWRWDRRSVSRFEQFRELTGWQHPVLEFGVCPARGTLTRLARAFDGFCRRVRNVETPGFPRFKSDTRWTRSSTRTGVPATPPEPSDSQVGIDVGIADLVATSDGDLIGNPRHLRRSLGPVGRRQRVVAGRKRGSTRRRTAARHVGRIHRKIACQRRDLAQVSRRLVNGYGLIVHTSQTCHTCGHVDAENRHATMFRCTSCGHVDHADINAARNILRAWLAHRPAREAHEHVA